ARDAAAAVTGLVAGDGAVVDRERADAEDATAVVELAGVSALHGHVAERQADAVEDIERAVFAPLRVDHGPAGRVSLDRDGVGDVEVPRRGGVVAALELELVLPRVERNGIRARRGVGQKDRLPE